MRVGWRPYSAPSTSSLLTSLYGVWNGDTLGTSLDTSVLSSWKADGLGTSLDTSIAGYWGAENVTTDAVSSNNGTLVNSATYSSGKIGNAFSFNGSNQYMSLPNNSLNYTGDFSISCWVNVSGINGWSQYIYAVSNLQNSGSNYYGWRLFIYGNGYAFDICNGTTTISGYASAGAQGLFYNAAYDISAQIAPVSGGAWKHVVITRKAGTGTKMYINGVLKTSNTSTVNPVYTTTHTPAIGGQIMNSGNSFGGSTSGVDLISTWNKELSQDEILSLYNLGNATEYPYSSKTLPSTSDSVGSNNGTLINGAAYSSSGKIGNSFLFDGVNDRIDLSSNAWEPAGNFTANMWIYANAVNITQTMFTVTASNGYLGVRFFLVNGNVAFRKFPSGTTTIEVATSGSEITAGTWKMVTFVNDTASGMKIYVDGILKGSNVNTSLISWGDSTINRIGANYDGGTVFNGRIDEFTTWTKVLTDDEITQLYNGNSGTQYPYSSQTLTSSKDAYSTNNGTLMNGCTFTTGKIGNAFLFDGVNDYVALPNNILKKTGDFSFSVWVNANVLSGNKAIFGTYFYDGTTYGWRLDFVNSGMNFAIFGSSQVNLGITGTFNTGQWYNIVVTRKASTGTKVYINGTLNVSNTSTINPNYATTQYTTIGATQYQPSTVTYYLNGKIDAVSVWDKELSATEVSDLYNSGNGKQYPNF